MGLVLPVRQTVRCVRQGRFHPLQPEHPLALLVLREDIALHTQQVAAQRATQDCIAPSLDSLRPPAPPAPQAFLALEAPLRAPHALQGITAPPPACQDALGVPLGTTAP